MTRVSPPDAVPPEPTRSAPVWRFMAGYFTRYLRRHMNALRLARWGLPEVVGHTGPIVVYCNHPSWWDAAVIILLGERFFPQRAHFAPFDARMLERYRIFAKLGAFPVDLESRRGAVQFLKAARAVLKRPERVLWITAQGGFRDVRARPLGLRPGVAHLAEIAPAAVFLPLALDYAFWDERGAEICCAFGEGIPAAVLLALPRTERLPHLEAALTGTLDRLCADVIARDAAAFVPVIDGRRGVGGVYDLWRRLAALLHGRRFDPAHRADSTDDPVTSSSHPDSSPRPHPEGRGEAEPRRSPPGIAEGPGDLLRGHFAAPQDEGEGRSLGGVMGSNPIEPERVR